MPSEDKSKTGLPLWKKLFFLSIVLFVFLLLGEVAVRFYYSSRALQPNVYARYGSERTPLLGFWFPPNMKGQYIKGLDTVVATNSYRMRGREEPREDRPELRVICVGASSVFGFGLDEEQSWPARTEDILRKAGVDAEVLNLACPGVNSAQVSAAVALIASKLQPDIVVFYQGWNDMTNYLYCPPGEWVDNRILSYESYYHCESWSDYFQTKTPNLPVLRNSAILFAAARAVEKFSPNRPATSEAENRKKIHLDNYRRNVENIISMVAGWKGKTVLMPLISRTTGAKDSERDAVNDILRKLAQERENAYFAELEKHRTTHKDEDWFIDAYHPSKQGSERIAELLSERILQRVQKH